jgi:hypothetical protein
MTLFGFSKKIFKINLKKLPSIIAKEISLIPLVKYQILTYKNTTNIQRQYRKIHYLLYQTLRVRKHHTMDPIMEMILSCSLDSLREHPPIELPLTIQYFSSYLITLLEPLYIVLPSPKNILEEESSKSRTF